MRCMYFLLSGNTCQRQLQSNLVVLIQIFHRLDYNIFLVCFNGSSQQYRADRCKFKYALSNPQLTTPVVCCTLLEFRYVTFYTKKRLPHPRFSIRICHLKVVELVFKEANEDKKATIAHECTMPCLPLLLIFSCSHYPLSLLGIYSVAACMWILVKFNICLFSVSRQQLHCISPRRISRQWGIVGRDYFCYCTGCLLFVQAVIPLFL